MPKPTIVLVHGACAGGDVKALVYIDAFVPEVGENVFEDLLR